MAKRIKVVYYNFYSAVCPAQKFWPRSQVVRQESAKLLHGSSILPEASKRCWAIPPQALKFKYARMLELVDSRHLKCREVYPRVGSSPTLGTK